MNYEKSNRAFNEIMEHWSKNNFGGWAVKETENPDFVIGFGGLTYKEFTNGIK